MKVANWELDTLKVFWDNYDTIDGTWVRDYIDVNDLIRWHLSAYKYMCKQKKSVLDVFNLWGW